MPGNPPEGPFPQGADPIIYDQVRRRLLWSMPIGLYLLGSRSGEQRNLMTTSLVMQVSMSPKLIAAAVESEAKTLGLIRSGKCFCVAILPKAERALVRKFVKPASYDEEAHELNGVAVIDAAFSGAPVPSVAIGYLDCALREEVELGSHHLVIGEVHDARYLDEQAQADGVLEMSDTRMSYGG